MYSFETRHKSTAVQSRIRRLLDLTIPNISHELRTERTEDRYNRLIPALLCAWERDQPVADSYAFVVTKDISSEGVGLVLSQPYRADEVLVAFCLPDGVAEEPWFFRGRAQSLRKVGAGFWTLGVQFIEYAGSGYSGKFATLSSLVDQLRPSSNLISPTAAIATETGRIR
jgi:hypothetical protein